MVPTPENDERLRCQRLAEGDESAFTALYDEYSVKLFRTAARCLGNAAEAEDVVQELFVALVRSRDKLREADCLAAYLFSALRRLVARSASVRQRQRDWQQTIRLPLMAEVQTPNSELREELNQALACLPDEQREVVALKIDANLTWQEIGRVLEISPNTAASRYRYALERLRTLLASSRGEES